MRVMMQQPRSSSFRFFLGRGWGGGAKPAHIPARAIPYHWAHCACPGRGPIHHHAAVSCPALFGGAGDVAGGGVLGRCHRAAFQTMPRRSHDTHLHSRAEA